MATARGGGDREVSPAGLVFLPSMIRMGLVSRVPSARRLLIGFHLASGERTPFGGPADGNDVDTPSWSSYRMGGSENPSDSLSWGFWSSDRLLRGDLGSVGHLHHHILWWQP